MSNRAITVENLGKRYTLGQLDPYKDFRESMMELLSFEKRRRKRNNQSIWVLKDVSFEVKQGEVIGIIGCNGAGKSTLLKILSRITEPTEGCATVKGRVGSLLEVGTGFHPELTGRENIHLNGAILGMTKAEVVRKFDEIVSFSEMEQFLDTPIKRYSSGMRVRLAFAVAAHFDPEILILDEVLAVGDAAFRRRCLDKMDNISQAGKTILFVSHNMAAVQTLCTRGILLEDGRKQMDGPIESVVNEYMRRSRPIMDNTNLRVRSDRTGVEWFRFEGVHFRDAIDQSPLNAVRVGRSIEIAIGYRCASATSMDAVMIAINFFSLTGVFYTSCQSDAVGKKFRVVPGRGTVTCVIPKWPLSVGRYAFDLIAFHSSQRLDWIKNAGYVDVESGDYYGTGQLSGKTPQGVYIDFDWKASSEEIRCQ